MPPDIITAKNPITGFFGRRPWWGTLIPQGGPRNDDDEQPPPGPSWFRREAAGDGRIVSRNCARSCGSRVATILALLNNKAVHHRDRANDAWNDDYY